MKIVPKPLMAATAVFAMLAVDAVTAKDKEREESKSPFKAYIGKLEYLRLYGRSSLKGPGFAQLSKLKNLRHLVLKEGTFSEELLPNLAKLQSLSKLNLWGCGGFSAKHMNELEALKDLKLLDLRRPFHGQKPFGGQDVKSLKTDLPQCNIRAGDRFY
jgi:hypothetical protein